MTTTWTAPEPAPFGDAPLLGDERSLLQAMLDWQRRSLHNVCAGLSAEQLAQRAVEPSRLSLLGLVRHLTKVERVWLRRRVAGQDVPRLYPVTDEDVDDLDPTRAADELAAHLEECRACDAAVAGLPLDTTFVNERDGDTYSLRYVYLHLLEEYARHLGHADLLRERIDGVTGR